MFVVLLYATGYSAGARNSISIRVRKRMIDSGDVCRMNDSNL